ncbi:hypothetical protein QMTAC487_27660 [Sphaerotilus sp. FB-3]|jgi:hypothetical protein|nr:hypothetical protein QMTAC487_27660 [Sphaerotilus sp. FB-3]
MGRKDVQHMDQAMSKSQKENSKHTCAVGDVLAVPLLDGRFGYVRIINIKDGWDLVEVLALTTPTAVFDDAVRSAPSLYPPVAFALEDVQAGLMKPVGQMPALRFDYVDLLWYRRGMPGRYTKIRVNQNKSEGLLSDSEAAELPDQEFHDFEMMVERVMQRLVSGRTVSDWLASRSLG